tara:strand:- start:1515 stop:1763 length:249 start_codon:yes stop_codon:yes gene_type:complete
MDFAVEIPSATKVVILERVITELELEIFELCNRQGIDVSTLAADYAAPAELEGGDGTEFNMERRIVSLNTRCIAAKAAKAAL